MNKSQHYQMPKGSVAHGLVSCHLSRERIDMGGIIRDAGLTVEEFKRLL